VFRDNGFRYRWRAALELDEEKGLHLHVFILIENVVANPCAIITSNRKTGKFRTLGDIMDSHLLDFHIAPPRNRMHESATGKRLNYATLGSEEKKADCAERLSYLVKARSKPDDIRGIYFSSRDSRKAGSAIH